MKSLCKLLLILIACLSLSGCAAHKSGAPSATGAKGEKPHIVFIFKVMGISYSDSLQKGVDRANNELGVNAELIGPTTGNDIQGQINLIEQQIARKVDAVVISANDADSVKPVMEKAMAAGVKVYTWDADSPGSKRIFYVAGCDDVQIGRDVASQLARSIGDKGKVGIMTGTLTANNLKLHVDGVREELKKHPGITVVDPLLACNDQKDQAVSKAISMLQAHPDLAGMAGVCSPAAPGTAEALIQTNKVGKVKVWGISLPSEVRTYLKKGVVQGAILWNPADLTYVAAMLVRDNLKSGALPKDGQDIPGIGRLKVNGDQVLIPGAVITKDNVDQFDF